MSMFFRIKAASRSSKMQVPRDQWPIFIYTHCQYNPEDTWKGTFRNAIIVAVSGKFNCLSISKHTTNSYICFTKFHRQDFQSHAIRECMHTWNDQCYTGINHLYSNSNTYSIRCCVQSDVTTSIGLLCSELLSGLLANRHDY